MQGSGKRLRLSGIVSECVIFLGLTLPALSVAVIGVIAYVYLISTFVKDVAAK